MWLQAAEEGLAQYETQGADTGLEQYDTQGEKRIIKQKSKLELEGFESSLNEEDEAEIRMEPLTKNDEIRLDSQKKQNYMP